MIKNTELIEACYPDQSDLRLDLTIHHNVTVKYFHSQITDASVLVTVHQKVLYVAFCGTDSLKDWWYNLQVIQTQADMVYDKHHLKVHSGFLEQYISIHATLIKTIKKLLSENTDIVSIKLVGYSLGGALAQLAAIDVYEEIGIKPFVTTYGTPRVGDFNFTDCYYDFTAFAYDYAFANDWVRFLPFSPSYETPSSRFDLGWYGGLHAHKLEYYKELEDLSYEYLLPGS